MASPLPTGKQTVSLASASLSGSNSLRGSTAVRGSKSVTGSRIRRDPPPLAKDIADPDPDQRDMRTVVVGILTFTLALFIIFIGISSAVGWTPRDYVAHL